MENETVSLRKLIAMAYCYKSVGDVNALDVNGRPRWMWFDEDAEKFINVYGYLVKDKFK